VRGNDWKQSLRALRLIVFFLTNSLNIKFEVVLEAMERTNLVLAKILDLAMTNGVSHWSLAFSDLNLDSEYGTYFYPCIEWLENEGLIRVGEYARTMGGLANGSVENIALTSRGMAVLGQKVEINGKPELLSSAVKKVSEGKVDYHRIGDAIGGIIGGVIKSIMG
jgi:hypothetical protein